MTLPTTTQLFDRMLADFESAFAPRAGVTRPAVDLVAYEDRVELVADLPGLCEKDIDVQFEDGRLTLRGERRTESAEEEAGGRVLRRERSLARFARSFTLGENVDVDGIEATMKDGVLRISIPKSERARPRQIQVTVN